MWTWFLALVLVALLVWVAGKRLDHGPRAEIGVTGGEQLPVATPTPTMMPTAERASRDRALEPAEQGRGGAKEEPAAPASPAPLP
jgi:hypothetical protein